MIIGVLGGGQLGRMLALAGIPLGFSFRFLDSDPDSPARVVGELINGRYEDAQVLDSFARGLDVITYEFENVPAHAVRALSERALVSPCADALETCQDRLSEKRLFHGLSIPTAPFRAVSGEVEIAAALEEFGGQGVLKTRRMGYDGKGQWLLRGPDSLRAVGAELPIGSDALILEGFVSFERELSLIAARSQRGEMVFYPLVQNLHEGGILRLSMAPAPSVSKSLQETAERYLTAVAESLDYVGVLTLELFQCGDMLLANEIAPRVHNSGHWTIEAAETSQFENHLRAVAGLPLGSTAMRDVAAMWNVLGSLPSAESVLSVPGAHLHLYGKEPRAGRKIGHITLCSTDGTGLAERLDRIRVLAPQS